MHNALIQTDTAARWICKATNPCILSLLMLFVILFTQFKGLVSLIVGSLTVSLFFILFPLEHIHRQYTRKENQGIFRLDPTRFLKQHPKSIIVFCLIYGLPAGFILWLLGVPGDMLHTLIAFLLTALIVAILNLVYRVSFHLAALTVLITMSIIIWGPALSVLIVSIPLVSWAKYQTHEHDPRQMVLGITLALIITAGTVYGIR